MHLMAAPVRTCNCGCGEVIPADAHHRRKYVNQTHRRRVESRKRRHPGKNHDKGQVLPPEDLAKEYRRGPQYQQFVADGWAEELLGGRWTQYEVAEQTGHPQPTISRWMTAYKVDRRNHALRESHEREEVFGDLATFTERFFPELDVPGFHREWIEAIKANGDEKGKLLLLAPQRHGKALDVATEMLTRDRGWVLAGDVKVGDHLVASDGGWTRVEAVHPQGVTDAWQVSFGDGSSLIACGRHRWAVQSRYAAAGVNRSLKDSWQIKTTEELRDIGKWSYPRIPMVAPLKGEDADLPFDPYLLGCWLGDGTTRAAAITSADPEIIRAFVDSGLTPTHRDQAGQAETVHFIGDQHGQGLHQTLKNLGVLGNKHVPEAYLRSTAENRLALLQGLMDTDGTVGGKSRQVSFSSTTPELAEAVKWLVTSLGGTWTEHYKKPWYYNADRERVYGKPAWTIGMLLPEGLMPFRLQRKIDKVPEHQPTRDPRRIIRSIESVEDRETVCFTVDADDHLFCAGRDLVVTHNSEMLIRYCLMRICQDPDISILWVSKTASLAEKMVGQVKATLEHHPELAEVCLGPGLSFKPPRTSGLSWTDSEFTVAARQTVKKTPTMVAIGTGGTIVGLDADEIILDDPQDHIRCMSPTQRDKDREWFFTDFMSRKMEQTALSFIMSRQHIDDLPGTILRDHSEDWEVLTYRAHDPACIFAEAKVDLHHECVLWPEYRSWKWLYGQKKADEAHFERNYMNNPKTDATTYITADDIDKLRDHTRRVGDVPSGCRLVAGIDPAEAKPVAATLWGFDGIHRHLIDAWEASASVVGMREILSTWPKKYGVREFAFEKNMGTAWLLDTEVKHLIQSQRLHVHQHYTSRVNKQSNAIGPVSMFQRMRTEPPEITIPAGRGEGLERIDRVVRSWLNFDPDWAGHKHADDDLTMSSWFCHYLIDTWATPPVREMSVDYAPFGGV